MTTVTNTHSASQGQVVVCTIDANNTAHPMLGISSSANFDPSQINNFAVGISGTYLLSTGGTQWTIAKAGTNANDGQATSSDQLFPSVSYNYLLNGTTWDRAQVLSSATDGQVAAQAGLQGIVARLQGFNASTWDRLIANGNGADGVATLTTGALNTKDFLFGFNGTTWDRWRSAGNNADAVSQSTTGVHKVASFPMGWNGASFDRLLSQGNNSDAVATSTLGVLKVANFGVLFNNSTFDRARSNSAANISATTQAGQTGVAEPGEWFINNAPAAANQATASKSAGAAGVRHVLRSLHFDLCAVNAQATPIVCVVRDGATGAGTIIWQGRLIAPAGVGITIDLAGLNIFGTAATAMTIETTAAPAAGNFVTVSASGYSTV